jgi:receptor protein-tyrosine kinase
MTLDGVLSVLWRRRLVLLLSWAACLVVVVVVTSSLPKTYRATAVAIASSRDGTSPSDPLVLEQLVRTYAALTGNVNVADEVRRSLDRPISRKALLDKMSFAPIERTRLLEIAAEDRSPVRAQALANEYARAFSARMNRRLPRDGIDGRLAVQEPAGVPRDPVRPNPPLYVALGAVVGLVLAIAAALVAEAVERRRGISDDAAGSFDEAIVGRVPRLSGRGHQPAVDGADGADGFALLKSNIDFLAGEPAQVLVVTSAARGEGKTSVASGLAQAAVRDGETVALVDANLAGQHLARAVPGNDHTVLEGGLRRVLDGRESGEEAFTAPTGPSMTVIHAAAPLPNAAAALRSDRFADLVEHLRSRYDRVIIDTPPVCAGAATSHAVRVADMVLFVVDARRSTQDVVRAGIAQLRVARAPDVALVINRAGGAPAASARRVPAGALPVAANGGARRP